MESKTLEDFQKLSGLSKDKAEECFTKHFKYYGAALASFAQSYKNIPKNFYENSDAPIKNLETINKELKVIYRLAREEKKKMFGKSDEEVWKQLSKSSATPSLFSVPKQSSLHANPAVGPFLAGEAKGSSSSSPVASLFAFGATQTPSTTLPASSPPFSGKEGGSLFSFGSLSSAVTSSAPLSGFGFDSAAAPAPQAPAPAEKKHKFCKPRHNVGPLLEMPSFWEEEVEAGASLFNLDGGYLARNKDKLRPMMEKWVSIASFYKKEVNYVEMEDRDEETVRVIIKDAERSFLTPTYREKLISFLHAMFVEFGAYGQAMSYLAGLCMLALDEEETAAVIRFVSSSYIKGHWAAEAVGFATSAWVVEFFMKKICPAVAQHLEDLKFWPDTYLQKILTGLCIHVLSFNELFEFLNAFMEGGFQYLVCFCLAVTEHFQSNLLKIKSSVEANTLYEIMALNSRVCHVADVQAILKRAKTINLGEEGEKISLIRSQIYDQKVGPRLSRAPKVATFEPCEICEKNRPVWYSDDLGAVCQDCKNKHPAVAFEAY